MKHRILIADDEPLYLRTTGQLLRKAGYDCTCVPDANQAMQLLSDEEFDLVLSDLNMPGNLKLELLHDHSRLRKHVPIIVITGVPSLPTAIESIRLGIADYLLKPVKFENLLRSVEQAIKNSDKTSAAATIPRREPSDLQLMFPDVLGESEAMIELLEIIERVAGTDTNILITGESGTGKEVVAKAIHQHSHRSTGAYQVIDCTAVPDSLFESTLFGHKKGSFTGAVRDEPGLLQQCDGGTAFFDELGELPLPMQAKLLRAVQEQTFTPVGSHEAVKVDTRFVCATNRDLEMEVSAGRFRQDLFYRLGVIHIELPPLRSRGTDVLLLAEQFLKSFTEKSKNITGLSSETKDLFRRYSWPGNIRELRNVIERSVALCRGQLVEPCDLPNNIRYPSESIAAAAPASGQPETVPIAHPPLPKDSLGMPPMAPGSREDAIKDAEHRYLQELMEARSGNVSEAARVAGLSRQGLHKLLRQHGIDAAEYR